VKSCRQSSKVNMHDTHISRFSEIKRAAKSLHSHHTSSFLLDDVNSRRNRCVSISLHSYLCCEVLNPDALGFKVQVSAAAAFARSIHSPAVVVSN
jgi:hypothetical protein